MSTLWIQTTYKPGHGQWVVVGDHASYEGGMDMTADITLPKAIICGLKNLGGKIETIRVVDNGSLAQLQNPTVWPWTDAAQLLDETGVTLSPVPARVIDKYIKSWLLNQETLRVG